MTDETRKELMAHCWKEVEVSPLRHSLRAMSPYVITKLDEHEVRFTASDGSRWRWVRGRNITKDNSPATMNKGPAGASPSSRQPITEPQGTAAHGTAQATEGGE